MTTNIKFKRSAVPGKIPTVAQIDLGEFAVNTNDGVLYTKKNVGGTESIVSFHGISGIGGSVDVSLTTATPNQILLTFPVAEFRTAKFLIQATAGSAHHVTELLLLHDGTNILTTEYATLITSSSLGTFDTDINTGNIRLLFSPNQVNTNIRIERILIRI